MAKARWFIIDSTLDAAPLHDKQQQAFPKLENALQLDVLVRGVSVCAGRAENKRWHAEYLLECEQVTGIGRSQHGRLPAGDLSHTPGQGGDQWLSLIHI